MPTTATCIAKQIKDISDAAHESIADLQALSDDSIEHMTNLEEWQKEIEAATKANSEAIAEVIRRLDAKDATEQAINEELDKLLD
jgi:hypothetical protein